MVLEGPKPLPDPMLTQLMTAYGITSHNNSQQAQDCSDLPNHPSAHLGPVKLCFWQVKILTIILKLCVLLVQISSKWAYRWVPWNLGRTLRTDLNVWRILVCFQFSWAVNDCESPVYTWCRCSKLASEKISWSTTSLWASPYCIYHLADVELVPTV